MPDLHKTTSFSISRDETMTVVDPATRKLQIPSASVFPTQATARPSDRSPSLCMLFIQGRCRQGSHCHQVHADPDVVRRLREAAAARPTCCQRHGDDHTGASLSDAAPKVDSISFDSLGTFPLDLIATTQGAHKLLAELAEGATTLEVTKASVCRLQVLGRCRYAQDCNFVHVCRELTELDPAAWGAEPRPATTKGSRSLRGRGMEGTESNNHSVLASSQQQSSNSPVGSMPVGTPPSQSLCGASLRRSCNNTSSFNNNCNSVNMSTSVPNGNDQAPGMSASANHSFLCPSIVGPPISSAARLAPLPLAAAVLNATRALVSPPMTPLMTPCMTPPLTPIMAPIGDCIAGITNTPPQSPPLRHCRDGSWAHDPYSWPATPTAERPAPMPQQA